MPPLAKCLHASLSHEAWPAFSSRFEGCDQDQTSCCARARKAAIYTLVQHAARPVCVYWPLLWRLVEFGSKLDKAADDRNRVAGCCFLEGCFGLQTAVAVWTAT